jgi:DNA-binding protein H-NS
MALSMNNKEILIKKRKLLESLINLKMDKMNKLNKEITESIDKLKEINDEIEQLDKK